MAATIFALRAMSSATFMVVFPPPDSGAVLFLDIGSLSVTVMDSNLLTQGQDFTRWPQPPLPHDTRPPAPVSREIFLLILLDPETLSPDQKGVGCTTPPPPPQGAPQR